MRRRVPGDGVQLLPEKGRFGARLVRPTAGRRSPAVRARERGGAARHVNSSPGGVPGSRPRLQARSPNGRGGAAWLQARGPLLTPDSDTSRTCSPLRSAADRNAGTFHVRPTPTAPGAFCSTPIIGRALPVGHRQAPGGRPGEEPPGSARPPPPGDCRVAVGPAATRLATTLRAAAVGRQRHHGGTVSGGEGGIRTHGTVSGSAVFKTAAFNRSATSPARADSSALQRSQPGRFIRCSPRSVISRCGFHCTSHR